MRAAELAIEPECPGFLAHFPAPEEIDRLYESIPTWTCTGATRRAGRAWRSCWS